MGEIRRYLNQVDEASPRIFAKMLLEPNQEQEQALRTYLGQDRFRRMRGLALQLLSRSSANLKGRIVLIPDFMEVPLCRVDWNGREEPTPIWMNISRLMKGEFDQLRLKDDGVTGVDSCYDIVPLGVFKRNYGELILTLAKDWDVRVLWYDWRKDLRIAASLLESKLREWFGVGQTAHLLGVGMGGLVARWFIKEYPDRWRRMWTDACKNRGGRLLLMGVPNRGTFVASQLLSGHSEIARRLVKIDHREGYSPIVTTFRSFTSVYQLLPRPSASSQVNGDPFKLFRVETYPTELPCETCETDPRVSDVEAWQSSRIPLRLLDFGREISSRLEIHDDDDATMRSNKELFENRTIVIAGYGVPTIVDLDWNPRTHLSHSYVVSRDRGDGIVPLERQDFQLPYSEAKEYYIRAEHTALMCHPKILSSLTTLLHADFPELLNDRVKLDLESAYPRNLDSGKVVDSDVASNHRAGRDDTEFWGILDHYSGRRHLPEPDEPTVEERLLGEGITRDLSPKSPHEDVTEVGTVKEPKKLTIGLGLVCGPINEVDQWVDSSPIRPDAIAVGLYAGEKPSGPVRDLDVEISNAMLGQDGQGAGDGAPPVSREPILTQFISRGLIRAELGQPFMMTDPRGQGGDGTPADRLLVVVGMGPPGKFGVPELTVLARELCWAVGRLGKKHLVVGSIGTKDNNLSASEAMSGWIRGIKAALELADKNEERHHLDRLTLLIEDPGNIKKLQEAILNIQHDRNGDTSQRTTDSILEIDYVPHDAVAIEAFERRAIEQAKRKVERQDTNGFDRPIEPTRLNLSLSGSEYRYGAVTKDASVPEREVTLRKELVEEVCTELSTERDLMLQLERGRFLGKLILPNDLKEVFKVNAPVVMTLDSDTARIPWEMVALEEERRSPFDPSGEKLGPENYFLGTCRGLTRQLRTTFAPSPESQPTLRQRLRVLVVADPARDHPLPGAELEGTEVADLFERFNLVHGGTENRVEVVRMFGPSEAKLTNVLREIMTRPYDVLHFAGHCVYNKDNPAASGWVFSDGKLLTANELRRIDLIPRFIFSNACESGVTPDRSDKRSAALPPTFAESFFARGVSNLVCTAWPVDDAAARIFAKALYAALLMMVDVVDEKPHKAGRLGKLPEISDKPASLMVMYEAMRYARLAIANAPGAARTWGAYQHYGDPFFRLLVPEALSRDDDGGGGPPGGGTENGRIRAGSKASVAPGGNGVETRPVPAEGGATPNGEADSEEPIQAFAERLVAAASSPAEEAPVGPKAKGKPRPDRLEKRKNEQG